MACLENGICTDEGCSCPEDTEDCGDICADTTTNKDHCSGCGKSCRSDQVCIESACDCAPGEAECDGTCVDLSSTDAHCGGCGQACSGGDSCWGGECLSGPCDGICNNPEYVTAAHDGYRVDPLGTAQRCFEVLNYHPTETNERIVCWNFDGSRSLRVNGYNVPCLTDEGHALTQQRGGGYCVQVGQGASNTAGFLLPTL
jgi:hypothetical protein